MKDSRYINPRMLRPAGQKTSHNRGGMIALSSEMMLIPTTSERERFFHQGTCHKRPNQKCGCEQVAREGERLVPNSSRD